ncbi:MAG: MotA/TolQ/ExbB proton channel family protein [Nitrospirae bacterium]|nr:MotA/TolQ/ExbB proton channel family protein [Nitrospirota bacterium]
MNSLASIVKFFQDGGFFMYPNLLILAIATAIVLERLVVLARSGAHGERLWSQLAPVVQGRRIDEAVRTCTQSTRPLNQVLAGGLRAMRGPFTREDVQGGIDEAMTRVIPSVEARLHYLPNFANVATLLGLLGTIIGLIQDFTAVSMADPAQKASLLAQGISVAMNNTAFGLVIAIPTMLAYTFLQSRANRIIESLEEHALRLINLAGQMAKSEMISDSYSNGAELNQARRAVGMVKGAAHAK